MVKSRDHHHGGCAGDHHHRSGGAGGGHPDKDGGVYCSICWVWVRSRHQLKQHQETNSRCRSLQRHGPAKITCNVCGKRVTAQRWAVEQHSWSCGANGDVERVLGDQQVEEAASSSNPKTWPDRSNSRVRLQSVMVVRGNINRSAGHNAPPEPAVPPKNVKGKNKGKGAEKKKQKKGNEDDTDDVPVIGRTEGQDEWDGDGDHRPGLQAEQASQISAWR